MKRPLVQKLSKMIRARMAREFADVPEHVLTKEEKKLFITPTTIMFRKELGRNRWGLVYFMADPRDEDRLLVSVGWTFVEPLVPVKLRDGLPTREPDGSYPNAAGAWGSDDVEILAGGNTGLGWILDIDPARFVASCEDALDEVMRKLHVVVPRFFGRIERSEGYQLRSVQAG